jgi:hypothetical protein
LAYPFNFSSGGGPATRPYASTLQHSDARGVYIDFNLARMTGANVLLVGPERRVEDVVRAHLPDINAGLVIRCQDTPPRLPPASSQQGPVVLRDVDFLTHEEQRRVFDWLDSRTDRLQVVSTASAPLRPLIEAGAFNDALYYRLNTVYIDLSE